MMERLRLALRVSMWLLLIATIFDLAIFLLTGEDEAGLGAALGCASWMAMWSVGWGA